MIKTDDNALRALQALLSVCNDSQQGYETAAEEVRDPDLERIFNSYAVQRLGFVEDLAERIRTLRGTPDLRPSLSGQLHRTWMDVKAATANAAAHAILVECERAEDMAVMAYRTALDTRDLDDQSRRLMQEQYESVQAAHDRVQQLRDSATYAYR